jgi:rhodanese-related sulfurtransferase
MSKQRRRLLWVAGIGLGVFALAGWLFASGTWELLSGAVPPASQEQLADALARGALIVDVRMDSEVNKEGALLVPGATHISLLRLPGELEGLPRDRPIVPFCVTGGRAGHAAYLLRKRGFEALNGGGVADLRAIVKAVVRPPASSAPNSGA